MLGVRYIHRQLLVGIDTVFFFFFFFPWPVRGPGEMEKYWFIYFNYNGLDLLYPAPAIYFLLTSRYMSIYHSPPLMQRPKQTVADTTIECRRLTVDKIEGEGEI